MYRRDPGNAVMTTENCFLHLNRLTACLYVHQNAYTNNLIHQKKISEKPEKVVPKAYEVNPVFVIVCWVYLHKDSCKKLNKSKYAAIISNNVLVLT